MVNRWMIWGGIAAAAAVGSFVLVPQIKGWVRGEIETVIHEYIVDNPEVIPEAMTRLEERRMAQMVGVIREDLERPFEGAWAGAADPQVTIVEFFDYACGYCRASLPDLERLLEENDDIRIVYRELPILSPESEQAARVSLSAARQREYTDFHRAMYAAGRPNNATIAQAQRAAGLDAAQVDSDMNADNVVAELRNNLDLARRLELTGTPAFIVGDRILSGAVGYERLSQAVQEVRDAARGGD
jgi:protein-disulfide isomerase